MTQPIMLCFATGQNLANLIPALQLRPETVWILATPSMKGQAQILKKRLEQHGIKAQVEPFDDRDITTLQNESSRIAEKLDGSPIIFNATGGTKQMAFIMADNALELLGPEVQGVIYADTQHQRIDWLRPRGKGSEAMQNILKLEDILGIQGFRLGTVSNRDDNWVKKAENRGMLTKELGDKADKLDGLFGALNALAQKAFKNRDIFNATQYLTYAPPQKFEYILKEAERYDLLKWDGDSAITFTDENAARYFGGGWIEEYTFFKLRGRCPNDYAINPILIASDNKTMNEMDAFVVHRNRLLAIECKTLRFGRDAGKDADILYKLDSLSQRAGGLMHDRMIVTARPLDEASTARAKELKIQVVAGKDIRNLSDHIRQWMDG